MGTAIHCARPHVSIIHLKKSTLGKKGIAMQCANLFHHRGPEIVFAPDRTYIAAAAEAAVFCLSVRGFGAFDGVAQICSISTRRPFDLIPERLRPPAPPVHVCGRVRLSRVPGHFYRWVCPVHPTFLQLGRTSHATRAKE